MQNITGKTGHKHCLNSLQAANLRGFHVSMNHTIYEKIHFNVVNRRVAWLKSLYSMSGDQTLAVYIN